MNEIVDELVTVQFTWSKRFGPCYDCGLPAAFRSGSEVFCAVCAANHAADGDAIERIEVD